MDIVGGDPAWPMGSEAKIVSGIDNHSRSVISAAFDRNRRLAERCNASRSIPVWCALVAPVERRGVSGDSAESAVRTRSRTIVPTGEYARGR
jgi:hypothetical protein